jgi:hypothetical protein
MADFLDYQLSELTLQVPALKLRELKHKLSESIRPRPTVDNSHLNSARMHTLLSQLDCGGQTSPNFQRHPQTVEFDFDEFYSSSDDLHEDSPIIQRQHTPPPPTYAAPVSPTSFDGKGIGIRLPLTVDTKKTKFTISNNSENKLTPPTRPSRECSFSSDGSTSPSLTVSSVSPKTPGKKIALNFVVVEDSHTPLEMPSESSSPTEKKRYDSASFMIDTSLGSSPASMPLASASPRAISASPGRALRISIYTGVEDDKGSVVDDSPKYRVSSAPVALLQSGRAVCVIKKDSLSEQCTPRRKRGQPKRKPVPKLSEGMKARETIMSKTASSLRSTVPRSGIVLSDTVALEIRIPDLKKLMKLHVERTILWEVLRQLILKKFVQKFAKVGKAMLGEMSLICSKNYEISSHGDWASCLADYSEETVIKMELV